MPASSLSVFPTLASPTAPSMATTPFANPRLLSICPASMPLSSLSVRICRITPTSRNLLPVPPILDCANSFSASSARRLRDSRMTKAGFCEGSGNMFGPIGGEGSFERGVREDAEGPLEVVRNVEVFERVELGCTGPRERREAAKSGSRASRETAISKGMNQHSNSCAEWQRRPAPTKVTWHG